LKEAAGDQMARRRSGYIIAEGGKKTLPTFNIRIGEKRTSIRLSPILDKAIARIAKYEDCEVDELCSYIDRTKGKGVARSTAIREFVVSYFMDAATEAGHRKAGHGKLIGKAKPRPRAAAKRHRSGG
jgi:predicted DNA-binding ribbon-helix-helix protein